MNTYLSITYSIISFIMGILMHKLKIKIRSLLKRNE